jgi:hypothetical protein
MTFPFDAHSEPVCSKRPQCSLVPGWSPFGEKYCLHHQMEMVITIEEGDYVGIVCRHIPDCTVSLRGLNLNVMLHVMFMNDAADWVERTSVEICLAVTHHLLDNH